MTREETLALLRSNELGLVARVLEAENPRSLLTRIAYDRQLGLLGSYLLDTKGSRAS